MKRTTHRSSRGTKLYAVRDKSGKFQDIQTYKRAHSADLRRRGTGNDRQRYVFVVCCNDFPDCVFESSKRAQEYARQQPKFAPPSLSRMYWHVNKVPMK